jgi:DNA-binding LacI/PurR family transcriptional regulator
MKQRFPTLKDVAERAGVSIQTVSSIVNDKPGYTDEMRKRVLEAVTELGYRPYAVARSLRTRRTRTIALLVSDIANPSFSTMASAAEDYAHSCGYTLCFYNTHDDVEREAQYMRMAAERWVDGMLFVSAEDHMKSLETLRIAEIPSVAIDRIPDQYSGPSVTLNNLRAGYIAASHLLDLGHRHIAHIAGPAGLRLAREREAGFRQAVAERGLTAEPSFGGIGHWECQTGYDVMRGILDRGKWPTGIFCANDRMAMGAMRAISEAGLRVPDDISVIGLDDIETAAFCNPPLTTVRHSFARLATIGMQLLIEILAGKEPEQQQILIEPKLMVRQSTAVPLATGQLSLAKGGEAATTRAQARA